MKLFQILSSIGHAAEGALFGATIGMGLAAPFPLNFIVPIGAGILLHQKLKGFQSSGR